MSKIKSIHFKNFKFFRDSNPLELEGKHLLLYGENGSGKSSVYYGLYTLLEASSKTKTEVKKYFDPDNNQSLVNIYADISNGPEHTNSYIQVEDTEAKVYRLSYSDTDCIANSNLLESCRASDFINYVSLLQFHLFKNSETADLHKVFVDTIFPYLSFPTCHYINRDINRVYDMYKTYKEGPQKTRNPRGAEILVYKNSPEYTSYTELERHFNNHMQELIDFINANINDRIKEFDYDFKVLLEYTPASHYKKDKSVDFNEFRILLRLTEYNGKPVNIEHPNTFLNEARLSALAFSIRWAVLDYRLQHDVAPEALKFLVLDDIMISLDMANRDSLIQIITHKLTQKFQILFLTHDMQIFSTVKQELLYLNNKEKEDELKDTDWLIQEIYDIEKGGIHEPIFQPNQSAYARALRYFRGDGCQVDYIASGNAIRQAIENAFKELFRKASVVRNTNGDTIDFDKLMIADCIDIARNNLLETGLSSDFISKVDSIKGCLLNPSSHDNPKRNFYRKDLLTAFGIYDTLCKCDIKTVVPKDETLSLTVIDQNSTRHEYQIITHQDIKAYRLIDSSNYSYQWDKGCFDIIVGDEPEHKPHKEKMVLPQLVAETFHHFVEYGLFAEEDIPPAEDAIVFKGKTLKAWIDE